MPAEIKVEKIFVICHYQGKKKIKTQNSNCAHESHMPRSLRDCGSHSNVHGCLKVSFKRQSLTICQERGRGSMGKKNV